MPATIFPNASASKSPVREKADLPTTSGETLSIPLQIVSLAQTAREAVASDDTLTMLKRAAEACLEKSQIAKNDLELLLSVGIYRSEFLTEPAIAALLAGDLQINDGGNPDDPRKTLAFDVLNGSLGFLNACYLVSELSRAGCLERAMIVAAEIENNAEFFPDRLLGLREMASAAILEESEDGETGFLAFSFDQFPEHAEAERAFVTWNEEGRPYVVHSLREEATLRHLEDIQKSVSRFLREQAVDAGEIRFLIPPQISPAFVQAVGLHLGFPKAETIDVSLEGQNLATSSTPVAMQAVLEGGLAQTGDLGLIVNVASGGQVGCALYRF